ncbi:hypothetical protein SCP_1100190 [Sparassis crispa]|uniref:Uncharacterized protein n=1 Tax=Sparassis crispa TaxID=139825 RepID=A0A401GYW1_9APHY|nr:hypothetical protein SCP_1100190 [Sparassis crispa]GBE87344.1 hypothetical protein SCP_1100190 [Sparassis crispa]
MCLICPSASQLCHRLVSPTPRASLLLAFISAIVHRVTQQSPRFSTPILRLSAEAEDALPYGAAVMHNVDVHASLSDVYLSPKLPLPPSASSLGGVCQSPIAAAIVPIIPNENAGSAHVSLDRISRMYIYPRNPAPSTGSRSVDTPACASPPNWKIAFASIVLPAHLPIPPSCDPICFGPLHSSTTRGGFGPLYPV